MHKIFQIALIAIMVLAAPAAQGRTALGNLVGIVVDAQGKPVSGASVVIQTSDGKHPHATRTDGHGHFQFARYETGQYDLRAESQGESSPWARRLMIHSHKTTRITLRLTEH